MACDGGVWSCVVAMRAQCFFELMVMVLLAFWIWYVERMDQIIV